MKVAIIGGGAAGFYSAIHVKENYPDAEVIIFEKAKKVLVKVKVSGGGRCNVTNGTNSIKELSSAYPRGANQLKKLFGNHNNKHVMEWFQSKGVALTIQPDNCVFPVSQDSQTIIDCFLNECKRLSIEIKTQHRIDKIEPKSDEKIALTINETNIQIFDKVILTTGGSPKESGLQWLVDLGHKIETPVPSLFTFNMPSESVTKLMGIVVEKNQTAIQGTKLKSDGPLLITHWGMSGPSILKLSAFGARILANLNYQFKLQVNWVDEKNTENVKLTIEKIIEEQGSKKLINYRAYLLPQRLWEYLIEKIELNPHQKWNEIGNKGINKLTNILTNDSYEVSGKTTFKEEFVTCGGISLESVNMKTMESKVVKNLYFAGELLDIDGITGGYNFQAAWTTGFTAAQLK